MISPVDLRTMELTGIPPAGRTGEALVRWQLAQVRGLIAYLRSNTFYEERLANIDEACIVAPGDLARLPFTCAGEVRTDPESLLCVPARAVHRIATIRTSGSTGEPKRFFFTEADLARTLDFFATGMRSLTGPGKRVAILLSSDVPDSIASLLQTALRRIGAQATIHGHIFDLGTAAEAVQGAHCLVGLPSELLRLCRRYPALRPESVLLTADYVPEVVRRDLESSWRCRTFSHYGMTETGYGLAVQCDCCSAHHLRHADVLVEVVDPVSGRRLPAGEDGEVVVTTFSHEAMPLLRYRTGDLASLDIGTCPCGGVLPRLGRIKGRIADAVNLGGFYLTPGELDETIYGCGGVRDYRASVRDVGTETVLSVVVDAEAETDHRTLERLLRGRLPEAVVLELTYEALPSSEGVKKRRIEREGQVAGVARTRKGPAAP